MTQVIGKQQDLHIDVAHEGSDCKITCLLNNYQVEEGYILKQIGIYAKLADDEDDILAIIGQQSGEQIHPAAEGEAEYEWITLLKVSGTSSITVEGGAGSLALKKDLFAHTNRQDNPHNVTAKDLGLDKVENTSPSDQIPIFEGAENRENIENGDTQATLWGKVKKWFADLKDAAFAGIANNCTTTEAGSVLDARQGKVLQEEVDAINSNIENLGGFTPIIDSTGKITGYKTEAGADTVFPFSSNIYGRGWHIANCSSMSINIDFKDIPGWKSLTLNDFIWAPSGVLTTSHPYAGGYSVTKATFSASYNSSNGIFTLSFSQRHNGSAAGEETPSYKGLVAVGIKV
ncbi:hypothetical protein [Parablautia intestinalis]|uniref:hypothetical protein n=1 Tax=Parablautia intestinalis TaxID=2320100 RepID=UPI00256EF97E|nr:hypothetical protein [Parablautia intestinalis]